MTKSALYCNHANEMPAECPCDDDCYCKENSCKHSWERRRNKESDRESQLTLDEVIQEIEKLSNCSPDSVIFTKREITALKQAVLMLKTIGSFRVLNQVAKEMEMPQ